jgi:hypothetical protein
VVHAVSNDRGSRVLTYSTCWELSAVSEDEKYPIHETGTNRTIKPIFNDCRSGSCHCWLVFWAFKEDLRG